MKTAGIVDTLDVVEPNCPSAAAGAAELESTTKRGANFQSKITDGPKLVEKNLIRA